MSLKTSEIPVKIIVKKSVSDNLFDEQIQAENLRHQSELDKIDEQECLQGVPLSKIIESLYFFKNNNVIIVGNKGQIANILYVVSILYEKYYQGQDELIIFNALEPIIDSFISNPEHYWRILRSTEERRVAEKQRHFEELRLIEEKRQSEAEEKERKARQIEKLNYAIHDIISKHTLEILKNPKTFHNYLKGYAGNESLSEINAIYRILEIPIQWQNAVGRVFKNRDFLIGKIIEDYYPSNIEDAKFALEKIIDTLFDLDIIYFEDKKKVYKIIPSQIASRKEKPAFLEFDNALKKIITDNGTGILDNIDKCRGLLKDYSGDAYLGEINTLVKILQESTKINSSMFTTTDKMTKTVITLLFSVLNEMGLEHSIVRKLQEQQRIEKQRRLEQEAWRKLAKQQEEDERLMQDKQRAFNSFIKSRKTVISFVATSVLFVIILINANTKSNIIQKISTPHYETAPQKKQSKIASSQPVTYGFVSATALNMRSTASTAGSIITLLHQNDSVQVLSSSGDWSKIKFNNFIGFVNNSYLSAEPVSVNNPRVQQHSVTVQAPKLNLAEKEGIEKN